MNSFIKPEAIDLQIRYASGNIFRKMLPYYFEKSNKAITKKCKFVGPLTPEVGTFLFETYVSPILNYHCELWCDVKEGPKFEAVQLKVLSIF